MPSSYDPKSIEPKWRKYWEEHKTYKTLDPESDSSGSLRSPPPLGKGRTSPGKFYALIEFPYPSGEGLHVGHPRSYTAMDIVVRKRRMEGYDVLYPIGFDAFGLPAENYAIKTKTHPAITTQKNIAHFTDQLKSLGFSFDWDRAVDTTDPEYYKWTQWIFLQLYKYGLAYKTEIAINWCLNCKIGLANEEVIQGRCERCGGPVEKRLKSQWMLKITEYADRLLNDLDTTQYLEKIKTQQREWIGKSSGVNWKQKVKGLDMHFESYDSVPQTFMAQTYAVIAPEHRMLPELVKGLPQEKEVLEFVEHIKRKKLEQGFEEEKEMEGIFTGRYLDNPFGTGDLPIWVASFVVADYGTGFVNCSAHDERDFAFAKKYGIPLRPVMFPADPVEAEKVRNLEYCYHHDPEAVMAAPEKFAGRKWGEVREDLIAYVQEQGLGYPKTQYKLRDWVFSRQRYWGEPIPLVYCEKCATQEFPAPKHTFTIKNPSAWTRLMNGKKRAKGLANGKHTPEVSVDEGDILGFYSPDRDAYLYGRVTKVHAFSYIEELAKADFLHGLLFDTDKSLTAEELAKLYQSYDPEYADLIKANGMRVFEFILENTGNRLNPGWIPLPDDQLPLKLPDVPMYEPTDTGESPLANLTDWINVQCPQCGGPAKRETDTMPNWAGSSWYFLRYIDPKDSEELASMDKLKYWMEVDWYNGGMEHTTLHLLYSRFWNKFLYDIGAVPTSEPYMKRTSHGMILGEGGMKMSKSKGNVVNPDDIVERYGADTLRLYEMFMGPFDQAIPWDSKGVEGCHRFLQRVWKLITEKTVTEKQEVGSKKQEGERSSSSSQEEVAERSEDGGVVQDNPKLTKLLHKTIKKVGEDIERMGFNTAVSACMILLNDAQEQEKVSRKFAETFVTILSPFVPFMAEELWASFGHTESVSKQPWPAYDPALVKDDEITLVVQVNGKVRDSLTVPADITKEDALKLAYEREDVQKWLEGKRIVKEVFVPGKLVSIVAQ